MMRSQAPQHRKTRSAPNRASCPAKCIKLISTALCELLTLITIVILLITRRYSRLLMAFGTILLLLLPTAMEWIFRCRMSLPLYLFTLLYALGPMLGNCWNFYDIVPGWDKLLHTCGGVAFAILGFYFFRLLSKSNTHLLTAVVFALCFSIALSVLWEFVEFGSDVLLGTDMQRDTPIFEIHSHMLTEELGEVGSIDHIDSVTVNGIPMPTGAYLDIGLIDTMMDMLVESVGALLACLVIYLDKGKHPLIESAS